MNRRSKVETAFAKWPRVEVTQANDGFCLTGRYTAPSGWWSVGFPALLVVLWMPLTLVTCSLSTNGDYTKATDQDFWGAPLLVTLVMLVLAGIGATFGRRRHLDVTIAREAIQIGRKQYMRGEGLNQFAIEEHQEAFAESRQKNPSRIYRDAMQVVMRYGEKRVPIAAFRKEDVRKAEALLVRLQHLNQHLEEMLGAASPGEAVAADDFGAARPIR